MSCWSRRPNRWTFCPWDHPNPQFVAQNCGIFLSTFQYLWDYAGPRVVFLTAYQFSYILDILFHSDSHRLSAIATGLLRDRVRCVNLAQKISNRIDGSLRYKTLYNTFCIASIFWRSDLISMIYLLSRNCMFIDKLWRNNDVTSSMLHCIVFAVELGHFIYRQTVT